MGASAITKGNMGSVGLSLRAMGICLYVAWIEIVYSGDAFVAASSTTLTAAGAIYPVATIGLVIGLICMAMNPIGLYGAFAKKRLVYVAGLIGAAATFVTCIPDLVPQIIFWACCFVAGAASGVVAMRCATVVADMESRSAVIVLALAQIGGILVFAFANAASSYFGPVGAVIILVASLPLSAVLLELDDGSPDITCDAFALRLPPGFARLAVVLGIMEFACAWARGFFPGTVDEQLFEWTRWATACAVLVVMVASIAVFARMRRDAPFGEAFYYVLLGSTLATGLVAVLGYSTPAASVLATALFIVTLVFAWAILFRVSFRSGATVATVFGIGYAAAAFGSDLGFIAGTVLSTYGMQSSTVMIVNLVAVAVCVVVCVLLLRRRDLVALMEPPADDERLFVPYPADHAGFAADPADLADHADPAVAAATDVAPATDGLADASPTESFSLDIARSDDDLGAASPDEAEAPAARFKARCAHIAEQYGLSEREAEVFVLMAKGNDARSISEHLYVSYNTSRSHIRNIYAKMNVHSRHEFFEILNDPSNRI